MKQKTLKIKVIRDISGLWMIVDTNTYYPIDESRYHTRKEGYDACECMYPSNSIWHGRRVHGGYRVDI